MNRDIHKNLVQEYISLGGDAKRAKRISAFSLENYCKLKYWVKNLKQDRCETQDTRFETQEASSEMQEAIGSQQSAVSPSPNKVFNDLISQYPTELHSTYKRRYELWLEACSLKVQLNEVAIEDEDTAYEIQTRMFDALEGMDKCQKALDYYKDYKRLLLTETQQDFKDLTPMELIKKRNNLRTNITKRKATIRKMEKALPEPSEETYKRDLHLLNLKREQLQEYENQVEQLNKIIDGK